MFVLRDETGHTGDVSGRSATVTVAVVGDDDVFAKSCSRDIVVVIPGNPGVAAFYTSFLETLSGELDDTRAVCLGFAGHGPGRRDGVFSVDEQVAFVASLVEKIRSVNAEARLHVVGHSVGAYVAVNVASQLPAASVASVNGLFPTVEHIAQGSNAVIRPVFVPGLRHAAAGIGGLVGWLLPASLKTRVAGMFAKTEDPAHLGVAASLADYSLLNNVLYMAGSEMHAIKDIPYATLEPIAEKSSFYYGEVDGWVPGHLIPKMRGHLEAITGRAPGHSPQCASPRVVEDKTSAPHAFVLSHSKEVAVAVAPMIRAA